MCTGRIGAGIRQSCSTCHSTEEDRVKDRRCLSRVQVETADTRKKEEEQPEVASLSESARGTEKREIHGKIAVFQCEQSLSDRPYFFENVCGGNGVVAEDLHLVVTFEALYNLCFEMPRHLKLCLVQ